MAKLLANVAFTESDQRWFAEASGDCNPMHMDAIAARKTQPGRPVVHGIHALLWALDSFFTECPSETVGNLSVVFEKFIGVDTEISLWMFPSSSGYRLEIRSGATKLTKIRISRQASGLPATSLTAQAERMRRLERPIELNFDQASRAQGRLALEPCGTRFSALARQMGEGTAPTLMGLSYLVGMVCPGLHSIFSRLDLSFAPGAVPDGDLVYSVSAAHDIFKLLTIDVATSVFAGQIEAFLVPPVVQPGTRELRALVGKDEFSRVDALVVGGSRGLGEITAKLLAAGGARVAISYAVGSSDADRVVADIVGNGGSCVALPINVLAPIEEQLAAVPFHPNQVYYYATSKIFIQKQAVFEASWLTEFQKIYVEGFFNLCQALSARETGETVVYYPSSVAIDERPADMVEYAMAKLAGELLCDALDKHLPRVKTLLTRLPRLLTDQTATVVPVETAEPSAIILDILRRMKGRA